MTEQESQQFIRELYTAFPDLFEWVTSNSPDPAGTHKTWHTTLSKCSLTECRSVLSRWLDGTLEPFKAYERSHVALVIRQTIAKDRDVQNKHNRTIEEIRKHQNAKARNYERHSNFAEIWAEAQQHIRDMQDGRITQEEFDKIKEELARKVT